METVPPSNKVTLNPQLLIAVPRGGGPAIGLGTNSVFELEAHLREAGIDPANCDIGTAKLATADFVVDWCQTNHMDFR